MLIKNVVRKGPKKGKPVAFTHVEAAMYAVERAVSSLNNKERIYWVLRKTIQINIVNGQVKGDGDYTATADGVADIGYTEVATDKFHMAKEHNIHVEYRSCRDSHGLPDIEITDFVLDPKNKNPRDIALFPRKSAPKPPAKKEEPKKVEAKTEVKAEPKKE